MLSKVFTRSIRSSSRVLNYANLQLTLFSKDNCGLCEKAKDVMQDLLTKNENLARSVDYKIVKIDDPKNKEWWEKYCFDIPVLHIEDSSDKDSLQKIFHRLKEEEVLEKIETFK